MPTCRTPILLLALLAISACDTGTPAGNERDAVVEPMLDGKNDEFNGIIDGGQLFFGDAVEETFDTDFTFFQFGFEARENAVLDVEITQAGSSRGLDTTLFLYRIDPDGGAPSQIAFDDDEGWGTLSRIRDFRLYADGEYALVVGTKGATGRGNFRLSLGCESGVCDLVATCPDRYERAMAECLTESGEDTDYSSPLHEMVGPCLGDAEEGSRCAFEEDVRCEDFDATFAACTEVWEQRYVSVPTGLTLETSSPTLAYEAAITAAGCGAEQPCSARVATAKWEGPVPSAESLLSLVRTLDAYGPGAAYLQWTDDDTWVPDDLRGVFGEVYGASDEFDAMVAAIDLDLSAVVMHSAETDWVEPGDGTIFHGVHNVLVDETTGTALFVATNLE